MRLYRTNSYFYLRSTTSRFRARMKIGKTNPIFENGSFLQCFDILLTYAKNFYLLKIHLNLFEIANLEETYPG